MAMQIQRSTLLPTERPTSIGISVLLVLMVGRWAACRECVDSVNRSDLPPRNTITSATTEEWTAERWRHGFDFRCIIQQGDRSAQSMSETDEYHWGLTARRAVDRLSVLAYGDRYVN